MNSPFFSVIVPIYNVEKYLRECVDSILNQSFTDFELILVDDGSPDGCPAICDAYALKDKRVKVIHKPNGGVSSARNTGLEIAAGEYVLFCDSDDHYIAGAFDKIIGELEQGKFDVLNYGYIKELSTHEHEPHSLKIGCSDSLSLTQVLMESMRSDGGELYFTEIWAQAFRRKLLEENQIRFVEKLKRSEDLIFTLQSYSSAVRVKRIPDVLYFYRYNTNSIMHSFAYSENTIQNSVLTMRCIRDIFTPGAIVSDRNLHKFYSKSLIRIAINPCIVHYRDLKCRYNARAKFVRTMIDSFHGALKIHGMELHSSVDIVSDFETFIISKRLFWCIDMYTRLLVLYQRLKDKSTRRK